ncbi:MAG: cyclic nucleotide-binding/CBS domain-containing protein [Candidatus Bathyarchaeia archaeon]
MSIKIPIRDVAHRLITIDAEASVSDAAQTMADREIGSIVITKNEKPIGIVTERDILNRVVAKGLDVKTVSVGSIMSSPLITVDAELGISDALQVMTKNNVRRLLVTDGDEVVGIVTERDLLRSVSAVLNAMRLFFK